MMIYCSHKSGGLSKNTALVEKKIRTLQLNDTENTYISPIHAFGFLYHDVDYDTGITWCLELLSKCDKMIVLSEISKGVQIDIDYCKKNGIPIEYKQMELCKM